MSPPGVLVVFAKLPRAGEVKTRMCPPLTREDAAAFYTAMLDDVLEATAACAPELGLEPVLAVQPARGCRELAVRAPAPFRVVRQRGASLAERMDWAVREAAAGGAQRVLLRGSDSPTLDGDAIAGVLAALERHDLALRPDRDGGYALVGLRRPVAGLFAHAMSTHDVLAQTLANARRAGLSAELAEAGFDLDTAGDLRWLAAARTAGRARICPRTLAFLDSRELWHFADLG